MSKQNPNDGLPNFVDLDKVHVEVISRDSTGQIQAFKTRPKEMPDFGKGPWDNTPEQNARR